MNGFENEDIGYRYLMWCYYTAPRLTVAEKARDLEAFAAEFEALLPHQEPSKGWAS